MIKSNRKWSWTFFLAVLAGLLVSGIPAQAQTRTKSVLFEKILYPENGNYYELIDLRRSPPYPNQSWRTIMNWEDAAKASKTLTFKGVQGRLVHVKTPELDSFLRITLRPNTNVWIGIRFDCETSGLYYEDGSHLTSRSYVFWHPTDWNRGDKGAKGTTLCPQGSVPYHGAYMAMGSHRSPYWALVGGGKGWYQFIVEYPVGEKAVSVSSDDGNDN